MNQEATFTRCLNLGLPTQGLIFLMFIKSWVHAFLSSNYNGQRHPLTSPPVWGTPGDRDGHWAAEARPPAGCRGCTSFAFPAGDLSLSPQFVLGL